MATTIEDVLSKYRIGVDSVCKSLGLDKEKALIGKGPKFILVSVIVPDVSEPVQRGIDIESVLATPDLQRWVDQDMQNLGLQIENILESRNVAQAVGGHQLKQPAKV